MIFRGKKYTAYIHVVYPRAKRDIFFSESGEFSLALCVAWFYWGHKVLDFNCPETCALLKRVCKIFNKQ